jgi:hypothetical protein
MSGAPKNVNLRGIFGNWDIGLTADDNISFESVTLSASVTLSYTGAYTTDFNSLSIALIGSGSEDEVNIIENES